MSTEENTKYTALCIEEVLKNFYGKQFTHKNVQDYYNEKCRYNINIHDNLLHALKVWNCLNLIQQ